MKRNGFTMIELIFVIVILGILAAVAIPRLAATRDDAKIAKLANDIQAAKQEIVAQVTATGDTSKSIDKYSNIIAQMINQGKAELEAANNKIVYFKTQNDTTGDLINCISLELTGTDINISQVTPAPASRICDGVKEIVHDAIIPVAGSRVKF